MHLVEIFVPARQPNEDAAMGPQMRRTRDLLIRKFGGLTEFSRAPARGFWNEAPADDAADTDDIVVFEVMAETLDRNWWSTFRKAMEQTLDQDEVLIRTHRVERL